MADGELLVFFVWQMQVWINIFTEHSQLHELLLLIFVQNDENQNTRKQILNFSYIYF